MKNLYRIYIDEVGNHNMKEPIGENERFLTLFGVIVNGETSKRLPQTSNVTFPIPNASIMMSTIGTAAVSTGSSCSTGQGKPSHVLLAHGLSESQSNGTIRFSMGRKTTKADLERVIHDIVTYCESHAKMNAVMPGSN